jgi:hypothetical protein
MKEAEKSAKSTAARVCNADGEAAGNRDPACFAMHRDDSTESSALSPAYVAKAICGSRVNTHKAPAPRARSPARLDVLARISENWVGIMKIKTGLSEVMWMAAGAAALLILMLVVLHFRDDRDPATQLAFKARRADLVGRMQLDLASASEAEKSAVLAITDQDSQTFADQARAASGKVEQQRRELGGLLTAGGTQGERDLLAQFTAAFAEFQRVDDDLLGLAVKNTNIKAYSLAFGPADIALEELCAALARLVATNADSPEAKTTMLLAFGAQVSALRIQTLLPPHIAEENDQKMDELEALMATEDTQVRKSLDGLTALPRVSKDPELATAASRYAEFSNIRRQILALSRENTNVRSLSISLNQKRRVMLACQAALSALQQAILAEPIAGTTYGAPAKPR